MQKKKRDIFVPKGIEIKIKKKNEKKRKRKSISQNKES